MAKATNTTQRKVFQSEPAMLPYILVFARSAGKMENYCDGFNLGEM